MSTILIKDIFEKIKISVVFISRVKVVSERANNLFWIKEMI